MGHPWRELLTKETQVNKLGEGSGRCMFQEDMDEDYHGVMEVRIHKILEIYL